jgi:hypothetical protein
MAGLRPGGIGPRLIDQIRAVEREFAELRRRVDRRWC